MTDPEQPVAVREFPSRTDGRGRFSAWVFVTTDFDRVVLSTETSYLQWQRERHPSIGTHIQGYVEVKGRISRKRMAEILGFPALEKGMPTGVNADGKKLMYGVAPRRGPQDVNIRYTSSSWYCRACSAGDAVGNLPYAKECNEGCTRRETKYRVSETTTVGVPFSCLQGGHAMQGAIVDSIKRGDKRKCILEAYGPYVAAHMPWFQHVLAAYCPKRTWKPTVYWLHGATGTDKSRIANAICTDAYFKSPDSRWFDGYDGHRVVVVNDLRKSTFSFSYLLDLLDRYPIMVETKGGMAPMLSCMFIITCSKSPTALWDEIAGVANENVGQLHRRCDHIVEFPQGLSDKQALVATARQQIHHFHYNDSDTLYGSWDPSTTPAGVVPPPFRSKNCEQEQ